MATFILFQIITESWGAFLSAICAAIVLRSEESQKTKPSIMLGKLLVFNGLLQLTDVILTSFKGDTAPYAIVVTNILTFVMFIIQFAIGSYAILFTFEVVKKNGGNPSKIYFNLCNIVAGIGLVMLVINIFAGHVYYIDEQNIYHRQWGTYVNFGLGFALIIINLVLAIRYKKYIRTTIMAAILVYSSLPLIAGLLQVAFYGASAGNLSVNVAALLLFIIYESDQKRLILSQEQKIQNHLQITESLAAIYLSVHALNLETNEITSFRSNAHIDQFLKDYPSVRVVMERIMSALSTEPFREEIVDFVNTDTLQERLQGKKMISCEFIGKYNGWCRASFMPACYNEEGKLTVVTYAVQVIQSEKENEKELMDLARTDRLTTLYNRLAYESDVVAIQEQGMPENMTVISIDLNNLKTLNDSKGHAVGDILLTSAASCLKTVFSDDAYIYRVGGDEFIVLLDSDEVKIQTFLRKLEYEELNYQNDFIGLLSMAYGYARVDETETGNISEALKIADRRMYDKKKAQKSS